MDMVNTIQERILDYIDNSDLGLEQEDKAKEFVLSELEGKSVHLKFFVQEELEHEDGFETIHVPLEHAIENKLNEFHLRQEFSELYLVFYDNNILAKEQEDGTVTYDKYTFNHEGDYVRVQISDTQADFLVSFKDFKEYFIKELEG